MTWKVALVVALMLSACAMPGSKSTAANGPPRCADLVAHAMTTQAPQPVNGAYACMAASLASSASQLGITDDASFAQFAESEPVYTAYKYVGKSADQKADPVWYYFELTPQICF